MFCWFLVCRWMHKIKGLLQPWLYINSHFFFHFKVTIIHLVPCSYIPYWNMYLMPWFFFFILAVLLVPTFLVQKQTRLGPQFVAVWVNNCLTLWEWSSDMHSEKKNCISHFEFGVFQASDRSIILPCDARK